MELGGAVAVLDDGLARREDDRRGVPVIGTLGLLLNAKHAGLVANVKDPLGYGQEPATVRPGIVPGMWRNFSVQITSIE